MFRCHVHDVVNAAAGDIHIGDVQRRGVSDSVRLVREQLAEAGGVDVRRSQNGFVQILTGSGVVIVMREHAGGRGNIGGCARRPAPVGGRHRHGVSAGAGRRCVQSSRRDRAG